MIDISAEKLLSLKEAARRLPGRLHYSTLFRWATNGTKYARLDTVVIGGQRYTSVEALQRFADQSTAAANGQRPAPPDCVSGIPYSSAQPSKSQRKRIEACERELKELGC